jgi:hypothetical protein
LLLISNASSREWQESLASIARLVDDVEQSLASIALFVDDADFDSNFQVSISSLDVAEYISIDTLLLWSFSCKDYVRSRPDDIAVSIFSAASILEELSDTLYS